jgi:hypothetical protein
VKAVDEWSLKYGKLCRQCKHTLLMHLDPNEQRVPCGFNQCKCGGFKTPDDLPAKSYPPVTTAGKVRKLKRTRWR